MHIKTGKFVQLLELSCWNSQLSIALNCCLADGASSIDSYLLAALNGGYETLSGANMLASYTFYEIIQTRHLLVDYF